MYDNLDTSMLPLAHMLLADFACDFFLQRPYSPDLAQSDSHMFTHLKQFLGGVCVGNDEVEKRVKDWCSGLAT